MKIYLVTPRNPPTFWTYDSILPVLGKACLFPNLSLPTLAGLTPPHHEVVLCDENVEPIDFDVEADVVGVTGYLVHRERMFQILEEFRRRGRLVVVGGPFASLCPEELRDRADVVFIDEAEDTWPRFLADLEAGAWQTEYRPTEKPDLGTAPAPRFDLLRVDRYHALTVQFARGCPFSCEFCDIIVVYGRRPRTKSIPQIMHEIETCHRLGARQIFLVDDNFIGNKKLAKALLRALAEWSAARGHPVHFQTEVSLNVADDPELLDLLRAAHVTAVFIGIESPRKAALAETRKTQNMRGGDMVEQVRRVQSYGIQVQAGMIVGFDADDPSIFDEQLRFIQDARIPVSMTGMLQAMPQTPLHARMAAEGRLLGRSNGDAFVFSNIVPKGMSRLELHRGYRDLIRALYAFPTYRARVRDFILHRVRPVGGFRLRARDLRLFGRMLRATLAGGDWRRAAFTLSLLVETLLRRPRAFEDAVRFALVHKAFHDYVEALGPPLDRAITTLEAQSRSHDSAARVSSGTLGPHQHVVAQAELVRLVRGDVDDVTQASQQDAL